jgi:hypothetical protein
MAIVAGKTVTFTAKVDTPTTAAHWQPSLDDIDTIRAADVSVGESTLPREAVSAINVASGSGSLRLTFFTARKTETISQIRLACGNAAMTGSPTVVRIGIYQEDTPGGNLTLVASTAHDATLWIATTTAYTRSLSASFTKTRGIRYAVAPLVVGATVYPSFYGNNALYGTEGGVDPRIGGLLGGQTDLPSTITSGSISSAVQLCYAVLLP